MQGAATTCMGAAAGAADGCAQRAVSGALEGLPSGGKTPQLSAPLAAAGGAITKRLCPCIMPEPHMLQASPSAHSACVTIESA